LRPTARNAPSGELDKSGGARQQQHACRTAVARTRSPRRERTLRSVFDHVRVFADRAVDEEPESMTNLVFFASPAPIDFELPHDYPFHNTACEQVLRAFRAWEVFQSISDGSVITDRRNPLGRLQSAANAAHFYAMNELLPIEVWLTN
jgi:hypothetical protein